MHRFKKQAQWHHNKTASNISFVQVLLSCVLS